MSYYLYPSSPVDLLKTHNIALAAPIAHNIISIGQDGSIKAQESDLDTALEHDPTLAKEIEIEREIMEISQQELPSLEAKKDTRVDGKLIVKEEIVEGHVTWGSMKLFMLGLGGNYPWIFFSLWISGILLTDWVTTFQVWFLGYWGSQYEGHSPSEVNVI